MTIMHNTHRLVITAVMLLIACGGGDPIQRFTPRDADERARDYLALIRRNQVDSAYSRLHPQLLADSSSHAALGKLADYLRGKQFDTTRVIGAQTNNINGVRHVNLSYELHGDSGWTLANVATVDSEGTWYVEGVSARPIRAPLEQINAFGLAGKSVGHYLVLAVALLMFAGSLIVAGWAVASRLPKRWIWAVVALLGFSQVQFNWSTGAVRMQLFNICFPIATYVQASAASPLLIGVGFPLGAIIVLEKIRRHRARASATTSIGSVQQQPAAR